METLRHKRSGDQETSQRASSSTSPTRTTRKPLNYARTTFPKITSIPKIERERETEKGRFFWNWKDARIEELEGELGKARESEEKTLESFTLQARQLAEAKNELEEARVEIRSLRGRIGVLERPEWQGEETARLRDQIKLASEVERRSRKGMDDFAVAFREVAVEASIANAKLVLAENDLAEVREQVECTRSTLRSSDEKHRASLEEIRKLRKEVEESAAGWSAKQGGLRDCIRLMEVEIGRGKKESIRLIEAREASKEETSRIRGLMNQALKEEAMAKEALEIVLSENSRLKDFISGKDEPPQQIEREKGSSGISSGSKPENHRCRSWSTLRDFVRSKSPNFRRRNSDRVAEDRRRGSSKVSSAGFDRPSMRDLFSSKELALSSSLNTKKVGFHKLYQVLSKRNSK